MLASVLIGLAFMTFDATSAAAAPGDLDLTFSGDGKLTDFLSRGDDSARGVAIQPDGKIVVAGTSWTGQVRGSDFAVVRYNTDGSLDTTFGTGGKVTTDFNSSYDFANAVAIQQDGKIVVAGKRGSTPRTPTLHLFATTLTARSILRSALTARLRRTSIQAPRKPTRSPFIRMERS